MDNLLASLDKAEHPLVAGASLVAHTLVGAHNERFLHHRRRGRNYRSCRFFGTAPLNKPFDAP
jgi:hypothetical protein